MRWILDLYEFSRYNVQVINFMLVKDSIALLHQVTLFRDKTFAQKVSRKRVTVPEKGHLSRKRGRSRKAALGCHGSKIDHRESFQNYRMSQICVDKIIRSSKLTTFFKQ